MPLEQILYTPKSGTSANEHPNTFVLMVNDDQYAKYRAGDKTIPLAAIVDSFQVFKFEKPGNQGQMLTPSKSELTSAFGTANETAVVEYMLEHGEPHSRHLPKKADAPGETGYVTSDLLNAERRAY